MNQTNILQVEADDSIDVEGELVTKLVPGDTMCTEGKLSGALVGQLSFRLTSRTPTSHPDVVICAGAVTVETEDGTFSGTDHLVWNTSNGEFVDYTVFDSGSGCFENMTGSMIILGTFDMASATGQSTYRLRAKSA
jgi:hypothetical protein